MEHEHRTIPKTTTKITHKKNEDDEYARDINPFQFFEENGFGTVGSYLAEKILTWCEELSPELVVEAMKRAVEFGCKKWKYVEVILKQWRDKGYQTIAEVHAEQIQFEQKKSNKRNPTPPKQGRDIPRFVNIDYSLGEDE